MTPSQSSSTQPAPAMNIASGLAVIVNPPTTIAMLGACDIVVSARPSAATQTNAQLRADLDALWSRLAAQDTAIER